MIKTNSKGLVLLLCLFAGPFFQLLGDSLWLTGNHEFSWNMWREAAYIFFIPTGFLFARIIEQKSLWWAIVACAFFIVGCVGAAAMMPLFRLGAFYPTGGQYDFPSVVSSVLGKKLFGVTLFPPGLCFPISLVLFGIGFLKHRVLKTGVGIAFILSGILFWLGNAGEMETILMIGDLWLLLTFCYAGYLVYINLTHNSATESLVANDGNITAGQPGI